MRASRPGLTSLVSKSFAGSIATQLIGAVAGILSSRLLGPEGKGLLVIVLVWPGLLAALGGGLGLEEAIVYLTARAPERRGAILSSSAVLAGGQALLLTALGWLLLPALIGSHNASLVPDARLYLAWVALSYFSLTAMATLQGGLQFTSLNLLRPVVVASTLVGLIALAVAQRVSVHEVVLVYLLANTLALVAAWALAIRAARPTRPDAGLFKPLLGFGVRAQLGHIAAVANERLDVVLISVLLPASQLGLYAAAVSLSAVVRVFGSSLALVALPALADGRDPAAARRDVSRLARTTVWSSVLAGAIAVALMPTAVGQLFGGAFAAATMPAQILVAAVAVLNVVRVLGAGLKGAGLPAQTSWGDAAGAALTLVLMLVLVPALGLVGAAAAAVLSYLASLGYLAWVAWRTMGIPPMALLVPTRGDVACVRAAGSRFFQRAHPATA